MIWIGEQSFNSTPSLTYKEYRIMASKMIKARFKKNKNLGFLLNDEEFMSDVTYTLAMSDARYDGTTGTLEGYRDQNVNYFIKSWREDSYKKKEKTNFEGCNKEEDEFSGSIFSFIKDSQDQIRDIINKDLVEFYLSFLSPRYQEIVKLYFCENLTYEEIGKTCGISKQRAEQIVKKSIKVMRYEYSNTIDN